MKNTQYLPLLLVVAQQLSSTCAFVCPTGSTWRTTTQLSAKKKKSRGSSGEGFGKSAAISESPSRTSSDRLSNEDDSDSIPRALQSIDSAAPTTSGSSDNLDIDPNLSDEARSKAILRQKFGLKSFEEQQADLGDYVQFKRQKKRRRNATNCEILKSYGPRTKISFPCFRHPRYVGSILS